MSEIVRPASPVCETIAKISINDDTINISFPERNEKFREVVKNKYFRWDNGVWYRKVDYKAGKIEDRVAEIGNLLLNAGFIVQISDETLRNNAINANYEDEKTRWLVVFSDNSYKDWVAIFWRRDDDLYYKAKELPSAKYVSGYVIVRKEQYEALLDFAEKYDVAISNGAKERIEEAKKAKLEALIPTIKKKGATKKEAQKETETGEIDPSLLDD